MRNLHDLRTRAAGISTFIQLHIELDPAISLTRAHEVSDAVEADICAAFPNAEVIIHQDPAGLERSGTAGAVLTTLMFSGTVAAHSVRNSRRSLLVLGLWPTRKRSIPTTKTRSLILTGASRGIGHATVKRFSSAGWRVITCSRHAFPENCPWAAGPEDHIQVDLADPDDTMRAVARCASASATASFMRLSTMRRFRPKGRSGERLDMLTSEMDVWRQVFEVNLFATIWLARGLIEELRRPRAPSSM